MGIRSSRQLHHAIQNVCYALAKGTIHGRPADVLPSVQKYLCGSHVVYFLDYPDHLDVIRILHQRQDTERHLNMIQNPSP